MPSAATKDATLSLNLELSPTVALICAQQRQSAYLLALLPSEPRSHQEVVEVLIHIHPLSALLCAERRVLRGSERGLIATSSAVRLDQTPAMVAAHAGRHALLLASSEDKRWIWRKRL